MDLLQTLAQKLKTNGLSVGDGIDTFRDYQPATPDNIVVINEYAGNPQAAGIDYGVRSVQILVRNTSSDAAKKRIWDIVTLLIKSTDPMQIIENRGMIVALRCTPFRLTTDALNRVVWCVNLGITTQNTI